MAVEQIAFGRVHSAESVSATLSNTPTEGHVLVLGLHVRAGVNPIIPDGWELLHFESVTYVYVKVSDGTETSVTVTFDGSGIATLCYVEMPDDVELGTPTVVSKDTGSSMGSFPSGSTRPILDTLVPSEIIAFAGVNGQVTFSNSATGGTTIWSINGQIDSSSSDLGSAESSLGSWSRRHVEEGSASHNFNPSWSPNGRARAVVVGFPLIEPEPEPAFYTVDIEVSGEGSVVIEPEQEEYEGGTEITITAVPGEGWQFSGWSGDVTGTNNPSTFTISKNALIAAAFIMALPELPSLFNSRWQQRYARIVERSMNVTIEIFVPGEATHDIQTDTWSQSETVLYTGKARAQPLRTARKESVPGNSTSSLPYLFSIPVRYNDIDLRPDQQVRVLVSPLNPQLPLFQYVIYEVGDSGNPIERTFYASVDQEVIVNGGDKDG